MAEITIDPSIYSEELCHLLKLEFGILNSSSARWKLIKTKNQNWALVDKEERKLEIDFDLNKKDYKRTHKGSGELIARALGIKDQVNHILDLTAGLGIDAVFLSQLGFQVTSIERNPLLVFLLQEAQKKTNREEIKKIKWVYSDANEYLKSVQINQPTSGYFDPMFPEKKKKALPRQEMVIFRELIGSDDDAEKTLMNAMRKNFSRIVVKRPLKSELLAQKPDFQLASKLVRYDVYYPRG